MMVIEAKSLDNILSLRRYADHNKVSFSDMVKMSSGYCPDMGYSINYFPMPYTTSFQGCGISFAIEHHPPCDDRSWVRHAVIEGCGPNPPAESVIEWVLGHLGFETHLSDCSVFLESHMGIGKINVMEVIKPTSPVLNIV